MLYSETFLEDLDVDLASRGSEECKSMSLNCAQRDSDPHVMIYNEPFIKLYESKTQTEKHVEKVFTTKKPSWNTKKPSKKHINIQHWGHTVDIDEI